jgi:hypothetical protein
MIKTDDVVVATINGHQYVTLVLQGQTKEWDHMVRVSDPEEPGEGTLVPVDDIDYLTPQLAEEILGV